MTDAKEMWGAIKSRFGRNDKFKKMHKYLLKQQFESFSVSSSEGLHKGYDRFQSLLSLFKTHCAGVTIEDANQKFLMSLPFAWSQVSLIMRTKPVHFARECRTKGNQDSRRRDARNTGYKARDNGKRPTKQDEHKATVTIDGEGVDWTGHAEDDIEDYALMAFNSSNSGSDTERGVTFMVYQIDMKSTFLYGEIEEEVYVTKPKGFEYPHNPKHVYRLAKLCMDFIKHQAWCDEFEVLMKGEFEMSAMGKLTFFLGLQVKQLPDGIFISQDKYVKDTLKKFDMESVRTATIPYEVRKPKSKDEPDDTVNVYLYRSMIGSLMDLTASRPDIMFAVSACSRHQYKKQTIIATSSTKAEYVAAASCCGQSTLGCSIPRPPMLLVVLVFLLVVPVHVDGWVSAGGCTIPTGRCTIPTGSYSFLMLDWFLLDYHNKVAYLEKGKGWAAYEQILDFLNRSHIRYALTHRPPIVFDSLVKQFWAIATVRTLEAGPLEIIATIDGNEVVVTESLIRTQLQLNDKNGLYEFNLHDVLDGMRKIGYPSDSSLDGPHMPLLAPMLVGPAGGDGADAVAAGAAAAIKVPPPPPLPAVPPTHTFSSSPGPSTAAQDIPVRDPTPVREPTPVKEPTPSPVREHTPFRELTHVSPRPPFPPPYHRSEEGGGDDVSSPKSNEASPTTAGIVAGGAEDSVALTDLSLKLNRCINRVTTLENEVGVTKKVLSGAVLTLVSRVKRLEGLLHQRKRKLVVFDSEGEEAATKEQDIYFDALHKLASTSLGGDTTIEAAYTIYKASQDAHASSNAGHDADEVLDDTTMPFRRTRTRRRRLRKTYTSSAFEHFQENISAVEDTIPTGDGIPADAQTTPAGSTPISAGSSMDPAGQAAAAAPSSAIQAANKGKASMVNDSLPADLLTKQERILKNLHDYQLGEDLAKKLQAEQEAEFARQQEELAQKAQAESVASPAEQGTGLSAQRRRELDAAQLIYTEADWLELMAKIATNSELSKQLLGDDVNEDNMNERLGMLLMRKRRELAEQSWVKPMNKTQQRDFMRDFVKKQSASLYNQGSCCSIHFADVSVPAAPSIAADTASERVSAEHTVDESTPLSSCSRRKQIAKKRVTPIVDVADDALIMFDRASGSDDDPLPYAPYAGWEMVTTPLGFIHAYYDMEEHTKHFTSLRELLHMVEKNDLRKLLGAVDNLYQREEPNTFALILGGDLRVFFSRLLMRMHMLSGVIRTAGVFAAGIYILVLSAATLKRMLKHGLEVPKLLVGGDLTMAEQLVSFIKAALRNAQSAV
nr:ribonuclease H-like domain, reverse transcriptase, RNA-dependent DNA polymerase [Tanacetum cinerariifolium]